MLVRIYEWLLVRLLLCLFLLWAALHWLDPTIRDHRGKEESNERK